MNQIGDIAVPELVLGEIKTVGVWGRGDSCRLDVTEKAGLPRRPICGPSSDSHTVSVPTQIIWALEEPHTRGLCGWTIEVNVF